MVEDPGERTWTLYVCPNPKCHVRLVRDGGSSELECWHGHALPDDAPSVMEPVRVVEERRLRQAEADRDKLDGMLTRLRQQHSENAEETLRIQKAAGVALGAGLEAVKQAERAREAEARVLELETERDRLAANIVTPEEHYDALARVEALEAALSNLVALKDGPRDATYRAEKDVAWDRARRELARARDARIRETETQ